MYIGAFMSVCYWLFSQFTEKKPQFLPECRFDVISILIFDLGRRKVTVLFHVVALQSYMSLAMWLHGILLTWERKTYSQ